MLTVAVEDPLSTAIVTKSGVPFPSTSPTTRALGGFGTEIYCGEGQTAVRVTPKHRNRWTSTVHDDGGEAVAIDVGSGDERRIPFVLTNHESRHRLHDEWA